MELKSLFESVIVCPRATPYPLETSHRHPNVYVWPKALPLHRLAFHSHLCHMFLGLAVLAACPSHLHLHFRALQLRVPGFSRVQRHNPKRLLTPCLPTRTPFRSNQRAVMRVVSLVTKSHTRPFDTALPTEALSNNVRRESSLKVKPCCFGTLPGM